MKLVVGISCDRGVSLQTLEQAIKLALQSVNLTLEAVCLMATVDQKSDETAILVLAKLRQWRLRFYPVSLLAQAHIAAYQQVVTRYMGAAHVSQAAASLAANAQNLLVEDYKYCGEDGKNATVSLARITS